MSKMEFVEINRMREYPDDSRIGNKEKLLGLFALHDGYLEISRKNLMDCIHSLEYHHLEKGIVRTFGYDDLRHRGYFWSESMDEDISELIRIEFLKEESDTLKITKDGFNWFNDIYHVMMGKIMFFYTKLMEGINVKEFFSKFT